jgi:hypothetical protein
VAGIAEDGQGAEEELWLCEVRAWLESIFVAGIAEQQPQHPQP